MVYAATTGVILYWKPDQHFVIHRAHHVWFDEYNSRLSVEDKHTPGSLLLWQYPKGRIQDSDLLNLIPCELDLTSTPFSGSLYLFTTYVASWVATVLLELGWGFNGTFTD